MKTIFTVASASVLLGLSACGSAPSRDGTANNAAESATPAAAAPAAGPAKAAGSAPPPLVLEGEGLRIARASPPRTIAFDTPEAAAIEAVTAALGGPPTGRGANAECGEGALRFAAWQDRITLWFQDGRFAGWEAGGDLKTAGGIGIGSTRADVAAVPGFEVEESTLGTEFRINELSGILASDAADARVTHLWDGATCMFR